MGVGLLLVEPAVAEDVNGKPASQILAGFDAAEPCFFDFLNKKAADMKACAAPLVSEDGTGSNRDKAYFAIGANFNASFSFDGLYDIYKHQGVDAALVEDMRKTALARYEAWDRLARQQHLSDEDIGAGLAANPEEVEEAIQIVKSLRVELESLKSKAP
jgi:hypothetical protein